MQSTGQTSRDASQPVQLSALITATSLGSFFLEPVFAIRSTPNTVIDTSNLNSIRNHSTEQFAEMQPKSVSHNCEYPNASPRECVKDYCDSGCNSRSLVLTLSSPAAYYSPLFACFQGIYV